MFLFGLESSSYIYQRMNSELFERIRRVLNQFSYGRAQKQWQCMRDRECFLCSLFTVHFDFDGISYSLFSF